MSKSKQKNESEAIRLYKPSIIRKIGLGILIIVTIVMCWSVIVDDTEFAAARRVSFVLAFAPICGYFILRLTIETTQQHLAIYEDGIEYRIGNTRLFSYWGNLSGFETRPLGYAVGIYSLAVELRQSSGSFENFLIIGHYQGDFIPLSLVNVPRLWQGCLPTILVDREKLAQTEFGSDLLHYAPHLFEYNDEKAKNV